MNISLSMHDVKRVTHRRHDFPAKDGEPPFSWHYLVIERESGEKVSVELCRGGNGNIAFENFPPDATAAAEEMLQLPESV